MRAVIEIEMDGAAFADDPGEELSNILHALSQRVFHAALDESFPLRDTNGNSVGTFKVEG